MPDAPSNLTATVLSCSSIRLNWDPLSSGSNLIPDAGGNYPDESIEPYVVPLIVGRTYEYTDGANEAGASMVDWESEEVIPIADNSTFVARGPATLGYEPLAPVTGSIKEVPIQSYRIFRNDVLVQELPPSAATFTDTSLAGLTLYNYRVEAVGVDGATASSTTVGLTPPCTLVLAGCSHTRQFARQTLDDGRKSEWVTVQETAIGILSPSIKRMYEMNLRTGERRPIATASGNGASGAALQATGTWLGLKEVGDGLADSGDHTTVNQSGAATSSSSSSSSFIGPQLPPPNRWPPGHNKDVRSPRDWRK